MQPNMAWEADRIGESAVHDVSEVGAGGACRGGA